MQDPTLDAALSGSVTLDGAVLPFDFYGPSFACSPCLDGSGIQPPSLDLSFKDLDEFALEGGFMFPKLNANIGSSNGLTVLMRSSSLIRFVTFLPEPSSGSITVLAVLGMLARSRRRPALARGACPKRGARRQAVLRALYLGVSVGTSLAGFSPSAAHRTRETVQTYATSDSLD